MGHRESIAGIQPFAEISQRPTTIVFKGYDPSLDRFVLLKTLRSEYAAQSDMRSVFLNEARLLARVRHPNVVTVFSSGEHDTVNYLVTEFVEGKALSELLEHGPLPPLIAVSIMTRIAEGLRAAHDKGVLHRDLKPENILVSDRGKVKITDFGLAIAGDSMQDKLPRISGTLSYLAPEVIEGRAPTAASDLFSCGATFYEMLTGQRAFNGDSDGLIIDAVLHSNPMRDVDQFCDAPAGLLVICNRLLRKDTTERISSCTELLDAIAEWTDSHAAAANESVIADYVLDPAEPRSSSREEPSDADATHAGMPVVPEWVAADAIHATGSAERGRRATRGSRRWSIAAVALIVIASAAIGIMIGLPDRAESTDTFGVAENTEVADRQSPSVIQVPVVPADSLSRRSRTQIANTDNRAPGLLRDPSTPPGRQADARDLLAESPGQSATLVDAEPEEGSVESETIPAERPNGFLSVRSVPWAPLWIDGAETGAQFGDTLSLPAGRHDVALRHPAFPEYRQDLSLDPGDHIQLDVSLWSTVARLSLVVVPWAEVEVDGVVVDTIPPQSGPIVLTPGTHRLKLRHPDLGEIERDLFFEAGEHKSLAYNLREASAQ